MANLESWLAQRDDPVAAMAQLVAELETELAGAQALLARAQADVQAGRPEPESLVTLQRQVRELLAGVDEARRRRDLLVAREQQARAALRLDEVIPGQSSSVADRLLQMAGARVAEREVQATAAKDLGTDEVTRIFAPDDRDLDYARELAELRRRFLLGKGESATPVR